MVLRLMSLDLLGGLLCALMLCLCTVILRNGMRELPKFALMFGLLCGINFVFYAMPVLGYVIAGKTEQRVLPMGSVDYGGEHGHTRQLSYTLTVRTMPLFDKNKGFVYNAQSLGELLMPSAMLLGAYLGLSSHYEFQSNIEALLPDTSDDESGITARQEATAAARERHYGAIFGAATGGVPPADQSKVGHKAFSGASHKLDA